MKDRLTMWAAKLRAEARLTLDWVARGLEAWAAQLRAEIAAEEANPELAKKITWRTVKRGAWLGVGLFAVMGLILGWSDGWGTGHMPFPLDEWRNVLILIIGFGAPVLAGVGLVVLLKAERYRLLVVSFFVALIPIFWHRISGPLDVLKIVVGMLFVFGLVWPILFAITWRYRKAPPPPPPPRKFGDAEIVNEATLRRTGIVDER